MRGNQTRVHALVLASIAVALPTISSAQSAKPPLSLSIRPAKGDAKAGSTVQIEITVKNISDHDISWGTAYVAPFVEVTDQANIVDGNGAKIPETEFGTRVMGHRTPDDEARSPSIVFGKDVWVPLKAGKSFTYQLNLDKLYDLSLPGKYVVQIERLDIDSNIAIKSNKITVTVIP